MISLSQSILTTLFPVLLVSTLVNTVPVMDMGADSTDIGDYSPSTSMFTSSANNNLIKSLLSAHNRNNNKNRWMIPEDNLISSLRDRILFIRPFMRYPFTRKRSCFINAGLSNNCDFKDFLSAANSRRIWESSSGPGKKRSGYETIRKTDNNMERVLDDFDANMNKRMECLSGLPGGDCENSFLGGESLGQDILRPGGRNPGRR